MKEPVSFELPLDMALLVEEFVNKDVRLTLRMKVKTPDTFKLKITRWKDIGVAVIPSERREILANFFNR